MKNFPGLRLWYSTPRSPAVKLGRCAASKLGGDTILLSKLAPGDTNPSDATDFIYFPGTIIILGLFIFWGATLGEGEWWRGCTYCTYENEILFSTKMFFF